MIATIQYRTSKQNLNISNYSGHVDWLAISSHSWLNQSRYCQSTLRWSSGKPACLVCRRSGVQTQVIQNIVLGLW